ncbi:MAG: c-type cytochrome [Proteiniphilum sp.]
MNKIINSVLSLLILPALVVGQQKYLSPTHITPCGDKGYVVLSTLPAIAKVDMDSETLLATFPMKFTPGNIAVSADGSVLYVTEYAGNGKLHTVSSQDGRILSSVTVGSYPMGVCVDKSGERAWVANRFSNDLSVIDLKKHRETARIPMAREPKSVILSPDGRTVVVANYLPNQPANEVLVTAEVSFVDTYNNAVLAHVPLPNGAQQLEDLCFSKKGDLVFVTHLLSRFQFPTTHLERGWMNSNALSILNTYTKEVEATVLLDDQYRGAANPCGLTLSEDGENLLIAVSGTHELIVLDLPRMMRKIRGSEKPVLDISNDLLFLGTIKKRVPLSGKGARYVAEKDGKVFVSDYFSGQLSVVDLADTRVVRSIKLGNELEMDDIRKGELDFADADLCFQNWQSCISCHPEARTDGLNWDQMNDGMGNPKSSKSLLYSHFTPPSMITGIRKDAETAVRAGYRYITFNQLPEEEAVKVDKYLRSLEAFPSPYLKDGKLSRKAEQGKKLFEKAGCASCHSGKYHTNGNKYNVGTGIEEYDGFAFDTPTLNEVWRTAPYLYDGRAKTMREVITIFNKGDKHGKTSKLNEKELQALEEYILSL